MYVISMDKQVQAIHALVEGNSIRATERMTGCHRDTIMRLGVRVGEACAQLHDGLVRKILAGKIECDEIWSFIGCKDKRRTEAHPWFYGDQYTFVAIDANTKLAISYLTGKRSAENTVKFMFDLRERLVGRPQISTDGFKPYIDAIERAFGLDVDFGMMIKNFESDTSKMTAAHRYSPGRIIDFERIILSGTPDEDTINTSFVERQNLTMRMQMRRFTRLTNGFSRKIENLRAAVALHFAHYNFCRVHETLRVTPAMMARVTDHVWSVSELINFAMSIPPAGDPYGLDRDCAA